MENKFSTIGLYRYYFKFLNITGIIPFRIDLDRNTKHLKGISCYTTGIYAYCNKAVVVLYTFYLLLGYLVMIKHIQLKNTSIYVISEISWLIALTFSFIFLSIINIKKHKICNFLCKWIQIQERLIDGKTHSYLKLQQTISLSKYCK